MRVSAINSTIYSQRNYEKTRPLQQKQDKLLTSGTDTTFKGVNSGIFGSCGGSIIGGLLFGPVGYFAGLAAGALIGHLADKDGELMD